MVELVSTFLNLVETFHPLAAAQQEAMRGSNRSFVHYCSADSALSIIRNRTVWMRKSSLMNDFMEFEYGLSCLNSSLSSLDGSRFNDIINTPYPGLTDEVYESFNHWIPDMQENTYITCIAEHDPSEDVLGRLSMWRAYGGRRGVALVLNPRVFLTPSNALNAWTSPVAYLTQESFHEKFLELINSIEKDIERVAHAGRDFVRSMLYSCLRGAVLCTKHPGFFEEREWRVVYSPASTPSDIIQPEVVNFKGVPQVIQKIPLKDMPDRGFFGADTSSLLRKIIIGPVEHYEALAMKEALLQELSSAGDTNSESKIVISDIPLRHQT